MQVKKDRSSIRQLAVNGNRINSRLVVVILYTEHIMRAAIIPGEEKRKRGRDGGGKCPAPSHGRRMAAIVGVDGEAVIVRIPPHSQ